MDAVSGAVSPTQNFSPEFVFMGVQADNIDGNSGSFQFLVPFNTENQQVVHISGSSIATAIASGRIGASLSISFYEKPLSKKNKEK